ncbi:MAG: PIN domain-containing protein [Acidobacteria bacterium]|nr:PIN domain-containing protein [Acidobacteriota bacterium]
MSAIVYFELSYGVHKSKSPIVSNYRLDSLIQKTAGVLEFSTDDAASAGRLRAYLESIKQPIGPYDTLIAGQALSRAMTLVTANVREFERVPGLNWQDWER